MKHKHILILGAALLMTAQAFSIAPDNNDDGVQQTLTVNEETVNATVSEIRIDGNNAVLLFTDGTTLTADMRLVTITMSYEETTSLTPIPSPTGEGSEYYTLDGIKLTIKPKAKGLYIQNGKKVVK